MADFRSPPLQLAIFGAGMAAGALLTYRHLRSGEDLVKAIAEQRRARLPSKIILVRHGESEGNADQTLYRTKADNQVELTETGSLQALAAGKRIAKIIGGDKVEVVVSPFTRTLQTLRNIRCAFEGQIVRTHIEPRIREQEFGNLQGEDFKSLRTEQSSVGRFWYRFPTGESGADVFDRVKAWWEDYVLGANLRVGYTPVDSLVVVTHGLTMRFVLMQLYQWSPDTFHTVWNAGNCDVYLLRKDLSKHGNSPYVLDDAQGDVPRSTKELVIETKGGKQQRLTLHDYLKLPQPRTEQFDKAKEMLAQQNEGLREEDIRRIDFWAGAVRKFM